MKKDDSLFGLIEFRRDYGLIGAGYWEGKIDFPPVGKSVEILIRAGSKGVEEAHGDFYRELERLYEQMIPSILSVLEGLPRNYLNGDYLINEVGEPEWKDFELNGIYIPKLAHPDPEWTLSYRYLPVNHINYVVYLEGWKPTHGDFDD